MAPFTHRIIRPFATELRAADEDLDHLLAFARKYTIEVKEFSPRQAGDFVIITYRDKRSGDVYTHREEGHIDHRYDLDQYVLWFKEAEFVEIEGQLLGESGKIDELPRHLVSNQPQAAGIGGLPLSESQPPLERDGLGVLSRLPLELRFDIYDYAFPHPHSFWQCYHGKQRGLTLLGSSHSDPVPEILFTSHAIRKEILRAPKSSACHGRALEVIIGSKVVACNFPLQANLQAGQSLQAKEVDVLPRGKTLFIGVQVPSPRSDEGMEMVRFNVRKVVKLLIEISANHTLPQVRVSFETNANTRGPKYFQSDFEALMRPFRILKLPPVVDGGEECRPLVIEQALPSGIRDARRSQLCKEIEDAVMTRK